LLDRSHSIAGDADHGSRDRTPDGNLTPMPQPTLLSILRERAGLQPDDKAFTYSDYEQIGIVSRQGQFTRLDA
jgi:hypothetical protein